ILFVLIFVFPSGGVKIGNFNFHFVKLDDFIHQKNPGYQDISFIMKQSSAIKADSLAAVYHQSIVLQGKEDSIFSNKSNYINVAFQYQSKGRLGDSLSALFFPLEFPQGNHRLIYSFFSSLYHLNQTRELIRVLHYGDSQIEGDRITSYIRNRLQESFGGGGIGLFPVVRGTNLSVSYAQNISGDWKSFSMNNTSGHQHINWGMLGNYATLQKDKKNNFYEGWIDLKRTNFSYPRSYAFHRCTFFYGDNTQPMAVTLLGNSGISRAGVLAPAKGINTQTWLLSTTPQQFTFRFWGKSSPKIYGIAFDDTSGVAVDNIPMRGSLGMNFTSMNIGFLKEMFHLLNIKLVIFQFGANVVPGLLTNYSFYERHLYYQLRLIRQIQPGLCVIVMGVSDMSRKNGENYESYPNIEKVRDAQRAAAFKAGCMFWDTYQAMGGKNSMPSWVFSNPSLARKDFVHFSPCGAKVIAEMFYNSLQREYRIYCKERSIHTKRKG
ncbi:MAG: hypothetical protein Q8910_07320, partial [Bacteroidota bacterium]|nr:hypothetical protein [Bacteroidota bacterium]